MSKKIVIYMLFLVALLCFSLAGCMNRYKQIQVCRNEQNAKYIKVEEAQHEKEVVWGKRWVIDQPEWTETISEPEYDIKYYPVCSICGKTLEGNLPYEHMDETGHTGWYAQTEYHYVGETMRTVVHEAEGHWEK